MMKVPCVWCESGGLACPQRGVIADRADPESCPVGSS